MLPRLVAAGHEVFALARSPQAAARVSALGATPVVADLDDPAALDSAFGTSRAEALVNVASLGFGHAPAILAAAEDAGLRRAVFVSTTAIFTTLNAASKSIRVAAEEAIRASALDWTIMRPTMIYGTPEDRNMWRLLRFVRRCPIVPLPDGGTSLLQPVHVDDVAGAILMALGCPGAIGRSYDLAGPVPLRLAQVVEQAAAAVGRRPHLQPVPARPIVSVLQALESAGHRAPIRAEQVKRLLEDKAFDISAARRDLHFAPVRFDQGITAEARMAPR